MINKACVNCKKPMNGGVYRKSNQCPHCFGLQNKTRSADNKRDIPLEQALKVQSVRKPVVVEKPSSAAKPDASIARKTAKTTKAPTQSGEIARPKTGGITKPRTSETIKPRTSDVAKSQTSEAIKPKTDGIVKPQTSEIAKTKASSTATSQTSQPQKRRISQYRQLNR